MVKLNEFMVDPAKQSSKSSATGIAYAQPKGPASRVFGMLKELLSLEPKIATHEITSISDEDTVLKIDEERIPFADIKTVELRHRTGRENRSIMDVVVWVSLPSKDLMYVDKDMTLKNVGFVRSGSSAMGELQNLASEQKIDVIES